MLALPALAGSEDQALRHLIRWTKRYRSGDIRFRVDAFFDEYAKARTPYAAAAASGSATGKRASTVQVVDWLRRYEGGNMSGAELVDRLQGRGGSRRVKRLDSLAEMLVVFHNAACARTDEVTLAETAGAFLGLATHTFGQSLAAEGDRWGVYRHHHPMLVRREARRHLVRLAARSAAARQRLVAVARGQIALESADLDAAEIALVALQHVDLARLDPGERYRVSRALVEILADPGNFWTQLAAAQLMAGLDTPYHGHLLRRTLRAATARVSARSGAPGAMVSLALVDASRTLLARARNHKRLQAAWKDVPSSVRAAAVALLEIVEDEALPRKLRLRALGALEEARHWHIVHRLAALLRRGSSEAIAAEILATLIAWTRYQGKDPGTWAAWHDRHHRDHDGPIPPPAYAAPPDPPRFYGIPVVGERVLFVIDTSGSMADPLDLRATDPARREIKINRTRAELVKALGRLDDRRMFNVLLFADVPILLEPDLVPATRAHRDQVIQRLQGLGGSGWTNLGAAVLAAFGRAKLGQPRLLPRSAPAGRVKRPSSPSHALPDQIILLTDGMPTKGDLFVPGDFLDEIQRLNRGVRIRIDCVALGAESDPYLMKAMAHRNGGTFVFLD